MRTPAATARPSLQALSHAFPLDAGVSRRSGPTALLSPVPSGLGQVGQQTPAVGEDESLVL
jgi:hypothetical protein